MKNSIILRKWRESDEESLAKYANNNNIARFLTDAFPHPYSLEDAKAFISSVKNENPTKCFAIDRCFDFGDIPLKICLMEKKLQ